MSKTKKHMTITERYEIEKMLGHSHNFNEISVKINRSKSTVSREVKKRCITLGSRFSNQKPENNVRCNKLILPPYVCNGCEKLHLCDLEQVVYIANPSQKSYKERLSEARKGTQLTDEEVQNLDSLISPLIKKGQSVNHIFSTHKDDINCSKKSIYNHIENGIISVKNIDLPRKVRYKKRKKTKKPQKEYSYRKGRSYKDFLLWKEQNPNLNYVEMDTVKGTRKKGKVMLTMLIVKHKVLLIFLIDSCSQKCVTEVFDYLSKTLGTRLFHKYFPAILTDNGSEFAHPDILEKAPYGGKRTKIFYCDPMASWQKGSLENAHELIRRVRPKGISFDDLSQDDCTLLLNHINSYCRDGLDEKSSFATVFPEKILGKKFIRKLGLKLIPPDDILLKPELIPNSKISSN